HTTILSTHILPEVSQTCDRVVIINKGRMVAVDTPDNLTARLRGSETIYAQVDALGRDVSDVLETVPGVTGVSIVDRHESAIGYEVSSEKGRDIRGDLPRAIGLQSRGLRRSSMSLEEIFLSLTTEEKDEKEEKEEWVPDQPDESGAEQHG